MSTKAYNKATAFSNDIVDWELVDRFTPEEYELYINAPKWEIDSNQFNSEDDYNQYWFNTTKSFIQASKAKIGKWQKAARSAIDTIEKLVEGTAGVFDAASALAAQPIPFASAQIDERVALLSINPAMPQIVSMQESQLPYVNALNTIMTMELEANNYETIVYGCFYDNEFYNCSIIKTTVNQFERGPYGQMGRVCIEQIEPDTVFWDPLAKKLHWNSMDYVIQLHEMEIGEIRKQWPLTSRGINPEMNDLLTGSVVDMHSEDYLESPVPKLGREQAMHRQKIQVAELWLKDSRLKFEPMKNPKAYIDYMDRFLVDKNGNVRGNFVPRYPNGRLIVTAGGKVLQDVPNPFAHGQAPFVFIPSAPRRTPATLGNANKIMVVTRKLNNIMRHIHAYAQSEIERPMHMDEGALSNPELSDHIPNRSTYAISLAPGKKLDRRPAQDLPGFTFTYLSTLQNALDLIAGSSAVMRGNISDGAQLSAEALSALQQYASSRLALSAKFFNVGIKQLGYQLMWLIRQTYDQKITVAVSMADGSSSTFDWQSDRKVFEKGDPTEIDLLRATEDYQVTIKAGTGQPGGQKQQGPMLELFRENAIDREALLDSMEYPGRQVITKRMRAKELEDIKAKAEGHELGINIGEEIRQNRAGRRPKD